MQSIEKDEKTGLMKLPNKLEPLVTEPDACGFGTISPRGGFQTAYGSPSK